MGNGSVARYMFAGHAIGAAARFHRLDETENLNHVIPTLGASVLPATGGRTEGKAETYRYNVDQPRQRCLFAVDRVATWVEGRGDENGTETELSIEIDGIDVVEKLHIDAVRLHLKSARKPGAEAVVTTDGSVIEGLRLGKVEARLTLDPELLGATGSDQQFEAWHRKKGRRLDRHGEYHAGTIVRGVELIGEERDKQDLSMEADHVIRWKGFGRIILGEVHVKGHERRVTMVRLAMGSDAGGSAAAADGQSNGGLGTG